MTVSVIAQLKMACLIPIKWSIPGRDKGMDVPKCDWIGPQKSISYWYPFGIIATRHSLSAYEPSGS